MEDLYDVIIVGGGPAGLTAALYLARAKYRVLVLEKEQLGGQITITHEVVNYPGVERTSGKNLTGIMHRQAEAFGAEFLMAEAQGFDLAGDIKTVRTDRGAYRCFGVLLATGAHPREAGFLGEAEHKGRGVAYCATCDGEFFTGRDVYVVGGGYAAAEESVFLTKFARHVTVLVRKNDFSCAASVAEAVKNHKKITVLTNTVLQEVSGRNGLDYIRYKNTATGEVTEVRSREGETFGVFVFVGYAPATALVKGVVELNEQGYILTDRNQKTNIDGVYAAGDVCIKPLRQVVTATGDGALAATSLEKYAYAMQQKTGLYPKLPQPKTQEAPAPAVPGTAEVGGLFTPEMRQQLDTVFARMERKLLLKLYLDDRPISGELKEFISQLEKLSQKLTVKIASGQEPHTPCVKVCLEDGRETGLAFHGVPSGHEFTSFVLGLYNAAGPGQPIDEDIRQRIRRLPSGVDMKILVTLSCTMCPDLVVAAQRIAAENSGVTAHVYDIRLFDDLKDRYQVMSVPCLIVNETQVFFGKKNISKILELLENLPSHQ